VDKAEHPRDECPESAPSADAGSRMLPRSMPNETPPVVSKRVAIILALLAVYVVWGSTYLGIKIALEGYAPFALGAIRMVVAGVLLLAWLKLRGAPWPSARQLANCAMVGTLLLCGGNGLVNYAELTVSSGMAAVAVASMPLFAALFAGWFGSWPSRRDWLGLAIGFSGVVLLNLGSQLSASPQGALALLAAPALWAFGSVWSRKRDLPEPWMNTALQMIAGGLAQALVSVSIGEPLPSEPSLRATMALVYLAAFGSIVAFTAYIYLLRTVRPALATSYAYVNPPVAVLFGLMLGGEHITTNDLASMAVIVAGVAVILTAKK
jgi:drug/metabolite transporter (DMT)-like permease